MSGKSKTARAEREVARAVGLATDHAVAAVETTLRIMRAPGRGAGFQLSAARTVLETAGVTMPPNMRVKIREGVQQVLDQVLDRVSAGARREVVEALVSLFDEAPEGVADSNRLDLASMSDEELDAELDAELRNAELRNAELRK